MKTIFEEKDLEAGLYIIRNSSSIDSRDYEFAMTVLFKIGFDAKTNEYSKISMTDGMTIRFEKKEDLLKTINEDKYGYRLLNIIQVTNLMREYAKKGIGYSQSLMR